MEPMELERELSRLNTHLLLLSEIVMARAAFERLETQVQAVLDRIARLEPAPIGPTRRARAAGLRQAVSEAAEQLRRLVASRG
jgi:hypothetical protein